jgi:hypothetical protein
MKFFLDEKIFYITFSNFEAKRAKIGAKNKKCTK